MTADKASQDARRVRNDANGQHDVASKAVAECKRQLSSAVKEGTQAEAALHKAQAVVKVQKQQLRAKEKLAKQSQAALGQLEQRHAELQGAALELTAQQDHLQAQRCNPQRHALTSPSAICISAISQARKKDERMSCACRDKAEQDMQVALRSSKPPSDDEERAVAQAKTYLASAQATHSSAQKKQQVACAAAESAAKALQSAQAKQSALQQSVDASQAQLATAQANLAQLHAKHAQLQQQVAAASTQLEATSRELAHAEQQVQDEARSQREGSTLERAIAHLVSESEKGAYSHPSCSTVYVRFELGFLRAGCKQA